MMTENGAESPETPEERYTHGLTHSRREFLQASGVAVGMSAFPRNEPVITVNNTDQSGALGLEQTKQIIEAAENKANDIDVPMCIAVVNQEGNLLGFHRMDDAILASVDIAIDKAYTAAAVQAPTADLSEAAQPGGPIFGIHTTNDGRIVIFGGGIPLETDDGVVGAIGVSGGQASQDVTVAQAGVNAYQNQNSVRKNTSSLVQ